MATIRRPVNGTSERPSEHGQILVLFCLAMVGILAAAGLAFDVGRFYSERRFLQNAADAAALAAANSIIRGETTTQADAAARDILTRNFQADPNGANPQLPPTTPVYATGHAGDPLYLVNGILISGGDVRVAVQADPGYTFGRAIGLGSNVIVAQARARTLGGLLPVAVRHYINAPGPNLVTTTPCTPADSDFQDLVATEDTSCLGTASDAHLRSTPSPGAAFSASTPDNDSSHHGPIISIVGDDAKPSNNASFRGFVALDIRNFESDTPSTTVYYNGVTVGMQPNTLKLLEAGWVATGYPGPAFPPVVSPPDPNDQVGLMSGNDTGQVVDAISQRYGPGDPVLVAVYSGTTMSIPDFQFTAPTAVAIDNTQNLDGTVTMALTANAAFGNGNVYAEAQPDNGALAANPPAPDPLELGTLAPITFSPYPTTAPATITWTSFHTNAALKGIYTIWIHGYSTSPSPVKDHWYPVALNVGGVKHDFNSNGNGKMFSMANTGGSDTEAIGFGTSSKGVSAFGGQVHLTIEGGENSPTLPTGLGSVTFSQNDFTLNAGDSVSVNVTINGGTLGPGLYPLTIRATGVNTSGARVTHLIPINLGIATANSSDEYVDIQGFSVYRIVCTPDTTLVAGCPANSITGYAISGVYADMNDPALSRGQVARLVPWS